MTALERALTQEKQYVTTVVASPLLRDAKQEII